MLVFYPKCSECVFKVIICLGLGNMRVKNFGETTSEERHKVFFSGKEDKHKHGIGFLVHKDIVNTVMGCRRISTIRLRAERKENTVLNRLHIGHSYLTHSFILRKEEAPVCVVCKL